MISIHDIGEPGLLLCAPVIIALFINILRIIHQYLFSNLIMKFLNCKLVSFKPAWLSPRWISKDGKTSIYDKNKLDSFLVDGFIRHCQPNSYIPQDITRLFSNYYDKPTINFKEKQCDKIQHAIDASTSWKGVKVLMESEMKTKLSKPYKLDLAKYCASTNQMKQMKVELLRATFNFMIRLFMLIYGVYVMLIANDFFISHSKQLTYFQDKVQLYDNLLIWYYIIALSTSYERFMVDFKQSDTKTLVYKIILLIMIWSTYMAGMMRTGAIAIFIGTMDIWFDLAEILRFTSFVFQYKWISLFHFIWCSKVIFFCEKVVWPMHDYGHHDTSFYTLIAGVSILIIQGFDLFWVASLSSNLFAGFKMPPTDNTEMVLDDEDDVDNVDNEELYEQV